MENKFNLAAKVPPKLLSTSNISIAMCVQFVFHQTFNKLIIKATVLFSVICPTKTKTVNCKIKC